MRTCRPPARRWALGLFGGVRGRGRQGGGMDWAWAACVARMLRGQERLCRAEGLNTRGCTARPQTAHPACRPMPLPTLLQVGGVRRFVDISVPRNIAPQLNELEGKAIVYNVDDLKEVRCCAGACGCALCCAVSCPVAVLPLPLGQVCNATCLPSSWLQWVAANPVRLLPPSPPSPRNRWWRPTRRSVRGRRPRPRCCSRRSSWRLRRGATPWRRCPPSRRCAARCALPARPALPAPDLLLCPAAGGVVAPVLRLPGASQVEQVPALPCLHCCCTACTATAQLAHSALPCLPSPAAGGVDPCNRAGEDAQQAGRRPDQQAEEGERYGGIKCGRATPAASSLLLLLHAAASTVCCCIQPAVHMSPLPSTTSPLPLSPTLCCPGD